MKALVLAVALAGLPAVASAGTLVAGAVRDTDGYAVAGAALAVAAADGRIVGRGTSAADGTFSIEADGAAAALEVRCRYCVPQRVGLTGDPPAVLVVRFAALRDRSPSPDDIAALPYGRVAQIAALVPNMLVTARGMSDRGLGGGYGATLVDGIPYYRPTDGYSSLDLVPGLGTFSFSAQPAGTAALYGQYGAGGTFDVGTLGETGAALQAGGGGAAGALRVAGPTASGTFVESTDGMLVRRATGQFGTPFGGGTLALVAAAAGSAVDGAAGLSLRYSASLPRYDAGASFSASSTRSLGFPGTTTGAGVRGEMHLRGRGPAALEVGVRVDQSSGSDGPSAVAGQQRETAIYADARSSGAWATLFAAVALQHETELLAGAPRWNGTAILPALRAEHRFDDHFALAASVSTGQYATNLLQLLPYVNATTPPYFVRSTVADLTLAYTDERRFRIEGMVYSSNGNDAASRIAGFGVNAAWQLTPQLALRTWALAAFAGVDDDAPPGAPYTYSSAVATPLRRQVAWLTYRNGVRFDILTHGAGIDGSIGIPLARSTTLFAGTFGGVPGRVVTLGLRFR